MLRHDAPTLERAPVQVGLIAVPSARPTFAVSRGRCRPFGPTPGPDGANFAVFSRHAEAVSLVLFKDGQDEPLVEFPLDPAVNKTGDVWHIFVHGFTPDLQYGYRVRGPFAPKAGHRYHPQAILLDPYAPAVSGGRWGEAREAAPRPAGRRDVRLGGRRPTGDAPVAYGDLRAARPRLYAPPLLRFGPSRHVPCPRGEESRTSARSA